MDEAGSQAERLFDEALDLVIRLTSDSQNPVAGETARRWRARSPDHETAWARAMEVHTLTGSVLAGPRDTTARSRPRVTRRGLMAAGVATAAASMAGLVFGPDLWLRAHADVLTGTGEIRRMDLPDGSKASVGPDSALSLAFGTGERRVELLSGMIFVEVRPDPQRPFRVSTGRVLATALGTAFDLWRDSGSVMVSVEHGSVSVAAGDTMLAGRPLGAGEWAVMRSGAPDFERGTCEPSEVAAWRSGTLVVEDQPIAAVVARIARWQSGRVMLADPALGQQRISGVYDLHDPIRALEAVVRPYGGHVRRVASVLTIIAPF